MHENKPALNGKRVISKISVEQKRWSKQVLAIKPPIDVCIAF
jgi:hypothetical protein